MSNWCFIAPFAKDVDSGSCTPLLCTEPFVGFCAENYNSSDVGTPNIKSCQTNFTADWLQEASRKDSNRVFNMDLTIILTRNSIVANVLDQDAQVETRIWEGKNCSAEKGPVDETCWLPGFDSCVEIPCGVSLTKLSASDSGGGTKLLTITCLFISLLSLLLTVLIYRNTEALQTKIIQLQIHCFVAHIAAILSFIAAGFASFRQTADLVCKIVAIVLHFSFLSVFSWMHIIAWSLFMMILGTRRFLAELVIQSPKWVESFVHYTLGWALPVAIVSCSIILDCYWSPGFMDYGKDGLCWINGNNGMLHLFLVSNWGG